MKIIDRFGVVAECLPEEQAHVLRHTAAHILAQAVQRLYPGARLAYGPATETGFYYDVDLGKRKLSEEDLSAIEGEMRTIAKENLSIRPVILSREEALELMRRRGENYKAEHILDLPENAVLSVYRQGEYVDLCLGPHLCYTKGLKAFRITGQSGAYWKRVEEAEKRDHRRIGREMGLFLFRREAPGFPFFLPKGMAIKNALIDYWRWLHSREGYQEISTPMLMHRQLWETSGHWDHYQENMYATTIEEETYCVKPMNCPGSVLVYRSQPHSYRDLPLRLGELGLVHRHEMRGALHGLFRVRCFTQDDAHIFLRREQITGEILRVVRLIDRVYHTFGFSCSVELSTRPENSMGSDQDWTAATDGLVRALDELDLPYQINEGDGAFYGPKIDFHLRDSLGRTWQCGTIQLDFQMPQNFGLDYVDEAGEMVCPILVHRVCFGSIERFIGILTEHYAGKFPLWLAPVQVKVLPISEKSEDYGRHVYERLQAVGIRCELDCRSEKIGYRIREAQVVDRVPYMLVVGQTEAENRTVSVRLRDAAEAFSMDLEEFLRKIQGENRHP